MSTSTKVETKVNPVCGGDEFTLYFRSYGGLSVETTVWLSPAELNLLAAQIEEQRAEFACQDCGEFPCGCRK